jgi:uncharacterized repeat protein (TIGR03803 family)
MRSAQARNHHGRIDLWMTIAALAVAILMIVAATQVQAQTYNVIYTFSGCADGNTPTSTLILDQSGSLYGTTEYGGTVCGNQGLGVVFKLKRTASGWINTPLHTFVGGGADGAGPANYGGLTVGPDGSFYGTTVAGGRSNLGIVFRLRPSPRVCRAAFCPWSEDILHSFSGNPDGAQPYGKLAFDAAGNIYGTTSEGGSSRFGTAYEVAPSGNGWSESVLYPIDGLPFAGLTLDHAGNLYGVNYEGGIGAGSLFQLTPSGSGWARNVLHTFMGQDDGANPLGGLIFDSSGNIFGSTTVLGVNGGGTVFEMSPSGGDWTLTTIHSFSGGAGPGSTLLMDAAGNLYGTTLSGGAFNSGSVFKLTHSGSGWTYSDLHDFQEGNGGLAPVGGVTMDSNGNLYGTASSGGAHNAGVVWEITP